MSALKPAGKPGMPAYCAAEGCGHEFPQDPCFEVDCPDCGAKKSQYCQRPSGHQGPFVLFHSGRDLLALKLGFYDHENREGRPCGKQSHQWQTLKIVDRKVQKGAHALKPLKSSDPVPITRQLTLF